jgi:hypothetical protein
VPSGATFHPFQQPAKANVRNDSLDPVILKHDGKVIASIPRRGERESEELGDYEVTDANGSPIVKAHLTGAVDLGLRIMA